MVVEGRPFARGGWVSGSPGVTPDE